MPAATTGIAPALEVEDEEQPSIPPLQSGIVLMPDSSERREAEDEDEVDECACEHDDDEFAMVTLDEVELLEVSAPAVARWRRQPRRFSSRARERHDRVERAASLQRSSGMCAPATEVLAGGMGVLLLLVAIWIVFSAALQ